MMPGAVYWLRNDLRLTSNSLLERARSEHTDLVCVYIHDTRLCLPSVGGLPRLGWHRRRFLRQTLNELKQNLDMQGIQFLELSGTPEEILPQLVEEKGASKLYFSRECAFDERLIEERLSKNLTARAVKCVTAWNGSLFDPEQLPFNYSETPEVFSVFRQKIESAGLDRLVEVSHADDSPRHSQSRPPRAFDPLSLSWSESQKESRPAVDAEPLERAERTLFEAVSHPQGPREKMAVMRGGEHAAQARLQDWIFSKQKVRSYFSTRNGLVDVDDSTLFSAWLAVGCLSPAQIFFQVREFEKRQGSCKDTQWVIFEILWREFFRLMFLKHGKKYFLKKGLRDCETQSSLKTEQIEAHLQKVLTAQTEEEFVNANLRELIQTGFMSNRGRQIVASHLIHDMQIPWTLGAALFESLLVDYDPCSNWGNWAYIAGVGNDPRGTRVFNVKKQQADYDPEGRYVSLWNGSCR